MINTENLKKLKELIDSAEHIVFPQPDKIDPDCLASSLAFKRVLEAQGKRVTVYTPEDIPETQRYIPGWDSVVKELPEDFDMAILVDAGSADIATRSIGPKEEEFAKRPFVIIDHHVPDDKKTPYATLSIIEENAPATGQMLYEIFTQLGWEIDKETADLIGFSILYDTYSLTIPGVTPKTLEVMKYIAELGSSIHSLTRRYKKVGGYDIELFKYKAKLIERIELHKDGKIAYIDFPREETEKYEGVLRPMDLVIGDMLQLKGVEIAIAVSDMGEYVKASMRSHPPIAGPAARQFEGGGGHDQAAAFGIKDSSIEEVKEKVLKVVEDLL